MYRTTPRRGARLLMAALLGTALGAGLLAAQPAAAVELHYADPAFQQVWTRTDGPVAAGQAGRSWYWGPAPGMIVREPFAGLPGGSHLVQYFDKSRMEINDPNGDRNSKWFVTNGLLTVELISGQMQIGLNQYENRSPADIWVATAGFTGIAVTPHDAPMGGNSLDDTLGLSFRIGPLGAMLRQNPEVASKARDDVRAALLAHVKDGAVWQPSATWVVTARNS
jgi:hypothetical protein